MRSYNEYRHQPVKFEYTIFDLAKRGEMELLLAEYALNADLDLNAQDHKGYSALMYAAYYNHLDLAHWLIEQDVDVNSPDLGGSTILMGVAFKGHLEMARLLLAAGASPEAKNAQGMTALQFAQMFGRQEMVQLLSGKEESFFTRKIQQLKTWCFYIAQKLQMKRSLQNEA